MLYYKNIIPPGLNASIRKADNLFKYSTILARTAIIISNSTTCTDALHGRLFEISKVSSSSMAVNKLCNANAVRIAEKMFRYAIHGLQTRASGVKSGKLGIMDWELGNRKCDYRPEWLKT